MLLSRRIKEGVMIIDNEREIIRLIERVFKVVIESLHETLDESAEEGKQTEGKGDEPTVTIPLSLAQTIADGLVYARDDFSGPVGDRKSAKLQAAHEELDAAIARATKLDTATGGVIVIADEEGVL